MGRLINLASAIGIASTLVSADTSFDLVSAAPCDIYANGGTPCVAAHGTTRGLYREYSGPLYQVTRNSDGTTTDIGTIKPGGVANAPAQDTFCANTTCVISIIYDQSGHNNHLTQAPPGGFNGPQSNGYDNLASAIGAPVIVHAKKVYGAFISPGTGYRIDNGNGTATGNDPEGIYAVLDGTHFNDACCFDYGNAEVSNTDTGSTHMEAIYFGDCTYWGEGTGNGPWVMADLENGLFSGYGYDLNNESSTTYRFSTAIVKGNSSDLWAIKGGNAQSGPLITGYSGPRPDGYYPMNKEGSIILGIGGDNSNGAQGTFYEGAMTTGYPTDETEARIQANIVSAHYKIAPLVDGPKVKVGTNITFRITTPGYDTRYIAHTNTTVNTQVITSSDNSTVQGSGLWTVRTGLGNSGCYSFESVDTPGYFMRHSAFEVYINAPDGSMLFNTDATFCTMAGLAQGNSIRSWSYPTRFFRHYANIVYIASEGGPEFFDNAYSYNNDVSFVVSTKGFEAPAST